MEDCLGSEEDFEAALERGGVALVNADAQEPYNRIDGRWRPAVLAEAVIQAALSPPRSVSPRSSGGRDRPRDR